VGVSSRPRKSLSRFLRWRDLAVVVLGIALGFWINRHSLREPTDYQKWQARAQLHALDGSISRLKAGQTGLPPCFFLVPTGVNDQLVASGSVSDCLLLTPDGKKLDLFEIALLGGFAHIKTDLYVPDVIPIALTRSIIPLADWARRNEVFLPHVYDPFLSGDRLPYTYLDWRLPDGESIHYVRVSPGTGYADAVYEAASSHPGFEGSKIKWNGWGWDLSLVDGTTFLSPEAYNATRPQQGSLVGIFDKQGREVRLSRKSSGALSEIDAPGGAWIKLDYRGNRMTRARSSAGNAAQYEYDREDRMVTVRYATGSSIKYSYDSSNRIVGLDDSSSGSKLEINYNSLGIVEQVMINEDVYRFHHLVDDTDITGPKGIVTRVHTEAKGGNMSYSVVQFAHTSDRP
jgi:YD repeat-containing protein